VQVPAGTVEAGEGLESALLRELQEESGIREINRPAPLGSYEFDMRAFGRDELQRRHVFQVAPTGHLPDSWDHTERNASDGGEYLFRFEWVELTEAERLLPEGQRRLLHLVNR